MPDCVIHIVDDEEAVRHSLAFLLTTEGFATQTHESATEFLAVADRIHWGCLLTDLRMPDMSGVDLLHRLAERNAMLPSIVISGHGDVPMAVEAMKAGAIDFIEKPFEETVLIEAIRRAVERSRAEHRTRTVLNPDVIRARLALLSHREQQVFSAVVEGLPNKTIAHDLDISPRTVEVHRANVMLKMQARNLAELIRFALAIGHKAGTPT